MSFNPDLNKEAQEVVFSSKLSKSSHPKILFNNASVVSASWQKHLGMFLDESLNFSYHIKEKMSKAVKGIGIIKKRSKTLPRHTLMPIYELFMRPHLDYGHIIYDQPNNESLNEKIERIKYNAYLSITGAIKGTSQSKLYNELCFESLKFRRWFRKLCTFYKIRTTGVPEYLFDHIPETNHIYNTRSSDVTTFYSRTDVYKYFFFPYTILEWNKLDKNIQQSKTIKSFRNYLLKIGRPTPKSVHDIHNLTGLKLLTMLRLGLSHHPNEHKFNRNFRDCWNPLCPRSLEVESSSHFFLHCHYHIDIRKTLFHELQSADENFLKQSDNEIVELFLYGCKKFNFQQNCSLLESAIKFILKSERFNGSTL